GSALPVPACLLRLGRPPSGCWPGRVRPPRPGRPPRSPPPRRARRFPSGSRGGQPPAREPVRFRAHLVAQCLADRDRSCDSPNGPLGMRRRVTRRAAGLCGETLETRCARRSTVTRWCEEVLVIALATAAPAA